MKPPQPMEFFPICPVKWIPQMRKFFEQRGPKPLNHMILAQFLKDPVYLKILQNCRRLGDRIILDNGAYEGVRVDERLLADYCTLLKPYIVVLPDVIGNAEETFVHSRAFAKYLKEREPEIKTMCVLHPTMGSIERVVKDYHTAGSIGNIIGITRNTEEFGTWRGFRLKGSRKRIVFASELQRTKQWLVAAPHHALGMLDGNTEEVWGLRQRGYTSIDSTAPIWRGLHGAHLLDPWSSKPFDPFDEFPDDWSTAEDNLREVLDACR